MAISEAEQRRVAIKGVLFSIPIFVVAVLLTINFGEDLISLAEDWPGGPAGFMVTLGAVDALALLLIAIACLVYAWPEQTPPQLRLSGRTRMTFAVAGGLVTIMTAVPLASTLPRRQGQSDSCDLSGFGCFMREVHSDAVLSGWVALMLVAFAGSLTLAMLFRRNRKERAPQAQP
ncbi:hypothetical protein [Streptomyces sp. 6N223]|uniref:hypothetical protein n=1 Tax=Streptomyces sp. 6N223 TaxID=3457412 RepID=UPI003FD01F92